MHCLTLCSGTIPNNPLVRKSTWHRAKEKQNPKQSWKNNQNQNELKSQIIFCFSKWPLSIIHSKSQISFSYFIALEAKLPLCPVRRKSYFLKKAPEIHSVYILSVSVINTF